MSITDELREWAEQHKGWHLFDMQLNNIADLIDNAALSERNAAYNKGYDEGFASADDWLADHEDAMAEHGWVRLPVDADGEYIRVGDVLDGYGKTIEVVELRIGRSGWVIISRDGNGYADTFAFAHHHAPTVEDVLREFGDWYAHVKGGCDEDGIIAEYAAKLQLRED